MGNAPAAGWLAAQARFAEAGVRERQIIARSGARPGRDDALQVQRWNDRVAIGLRRASKR
jgi:hypothetical protein